MTRRPSVASQEVMEQHLVETKSDGITDLLWIKCGTPFGPPAVGERWERNLALTFRCRQGDSAILFGR